MKRTIALLLGIFMLLAMVAGCAAPAAPTQETSQSNTPAVNGPASANDPQPTSQPDGKKLKVGLLLTGDISDMGWNYSAYDGVTRIGEALGAEINYVTNVKAADYQALARSYGAEGYDYVFGHGYQFVDAFEVVAPDFPDTVYIVNSSDATQEPNFVSTYIDNFEQGVLQGLFAAKYSKTKKVAFIGSVEIPPVIQSLAGARIGVAYADPEVELFETYVGEATDVTRGKELTLAFMEQGVDTFVCFASGASAGVYEALESQPEKKCVAIGSTMDRYNESPNHIVTSVLADYAVVDSYLVTSWEGGSLPFEVKQYSFGIKEGAVGYADRREHWVQDIPDDVWNFCKKFEQAVRDGDIVVRGVTDATQIPRID